MNTSESEHLFNSSKEHLVGGVNSPVRAFKSVGGHPIFMERGEGPHLFSADGEKYIDYVLAYGPMIMGHAHPLITDALISATQKGTAFGAPGELELTLSELITSFMPHMEKVRMVNSGTEATMSALRLARGVTKRPYIVKFSGCYHGHSDSLLVSAGSGGLTFGQPDSAGVLPELAHFTLSLEYNNLEEVTQVFSEKGSEIAAVIVEPAAGNMGLIAPHPDFLKTLRTLCDQSGSILIFDEVMTGFRVSLGGASELFSVTPDLTCLGKVIGGGLPCGAFGGPAEIMDQLAPLGPVYQAGTLSGNPLVMSAGITALEHLRRTDDFSHAVALTSNLVDQLNTLAAEHGWAFSTHNIGTMFGLFCRSGLPTNLTEVQQCDFDVFNRFFHHCLENGIYIPPSQYEACFMSITHGDTQIEHTISTIKEFFHSI